MRDYPERLRNFNKAGQLQYEWFNEVADHIEELEAKLAAKEKLMLALAGDKIDLVSELAGVKGKLAKVVEELEEYKWMYEDLGK